ncbi:hypothetical protein B0H17DRAFT_1123695 [Mycena rosella]|uniref:Uncharacterized protein n=1 Tax=Mycena rosella TaxID=1033263 RepID=A0AAD7H2T6_MYCRO|nr:hypothetical protein B0H17DRAFT_1123695 [Mycena rosella]
MALHEGVEVVLAALATSTSPRRPGAVELGAEIEPDEHVEERLEHVAWVDTLCRGGVRVRDEIVGSEADDVESRYGPAQIEIALGASRGPRSKSNPAILVLEKVFFQKSSRFGISDAKAASALGNWVRAVVHFLVSEPRGNATAYTAKVPPDRLQLGWSQVYQLQLYLVSAGIQVVASCTYQVAATACFHVFPRWQPGRLIIWHTVRDIEDGALEVFDPFDVHEALKRGRQLEEVCCQCRRRQRNA